MRYSHLAIALAAATLLASATFAARPTRPVREALPLKEFMGHVMQRNAEQLWAWSAEEMDATGVHSGKPADEAAWENAESDALTLTELTYVLESPSYRLPAKEWPRYVARARAAAVASGKAAEAHDYPALKRRRMV